MGLMESVPDFRSLSLRDLLEAREQYHWHLANRRNVIGTAVGLHLIRKTDPWPDRDHPHAERSGGNEAPRTLSNSEVRPYSWPSVLVFVDHWVKRLEFNRKLNPQELLPETLYLPDGRTVPVCVILAERGEPAPDRFTSSVWPNTQAGGGFPLVVTSQNVERRASVGCMVSDGHNLYALTNRHVCGEEGERIFAETRTGRIDVGSSSARQLARRPFGEVYPSFPGAKTYLNLDAGLVEVDDANLWTGSVYGLGEVGEIADLNEANIGLQLIDRPVFAYGAASGRLGGTIKALFYRYSSLGGYDYVADLLIAPNTPGTCTQPGDSGTVWHVALPQYGEPSLHPLAVEWGAQTLGENGNARNFALATNLSNICRLLEVEVVLNHNVAAQPYWGATAHYSIAGTAISGVREPKLGAFLRANAELISFDRSSLESGTIDEVLKKAELIPLADVPDVTWKRPKRQNNGGRDGAPNDRPEHPAHYSDIDDPGDDGITLRVLCMRDASNVDVSVWQSFYDAKGKHSPADRGFLPFRVWQFYDAMVSFLRDQDYVGYLCAAGILTHYVADACEPLHGSFLADGDPGQITTHTTKTGKVVSVKYGQGIHSAYETHMIDRHARDLFPMIDKDLRRPGRRLAPITTGRDAAVATVALMDRTAKTLPPRKLLDTYVELGGGSSHETIDRLWDSFGTATAAVMADGIRVLRHLWISAWRAGGGPDTAPTRLGAIDASAVEVRYKDLEFVPSLDLDHIGAVLH